MADTNEEASFSEFATLAGFRPSYVTELKKAGRLVLTTDGKRVRVKESLTLIASTRDPSKAGVSARHAANRESNGGPGADDRGHASEAATLPVDASDDDEEEESEESGPSLYQEARARREHYAALAAQRDFEKSMGNLLDAREIDDAVATAIVVFRTTLESLRYTLAPQLAAESDEGRVSALLADEHEQVLKEISRKFANLAKGSVA